MLMSSARYETQCVWSKTTTTLYFEIGHSEEVMLYCSDYIILRESIDQDKLFESLLKIIGTA